jgi:hypothetical protein
VTMGFFNVSTTQLQTQKRRNPIPFWVPKTKHKKIF